MISDQSHVIQNKTAYNYVITASCFSYVINQISCTEQINTGQLLGIGMLPASGVNECEKVNTNMVLRPNGKISSA